MSFLEQSILNADENQLQTLLPNLSNEVLDRYTTGQSLSTPLLFAFENRMEKPTLFSSILSHIKYPAGSFNTSNLALIAAFGNFPNTLKCLIKKNFETPKSYAKIVRLINEPNNNEETSLHIAARHGHTRVANLLIKYGASTQVKNKEKMTPLSVAYVCGHWEIVKHLMFHTVMDNVKNDPSVDEETLVKTVATGIIKGLGFIFIYF